MGKRNLDEAIRKALHESRHEVNLHDQIMIGVVKEENLRLKHSYVFELILSALLIVLSVVAILLFNWYFTAFKNVFMFFPFGIGIMKILSIGIFFIIVAVLVGINARLVYFLLRDRNESSQPIKLIEK